MVFFSPKRIDIPSGDSFGYDKIALNLISYREFAFEKGKPTAQREPGYPYFLALIYSIFGHNYNVVKIAQSIISTVSCFLIFLIGKKIFNSAVGLLSAFLASINPNFIYYSGAILREIFFLFILLLSIYLLITTADKKENRYSLLFVTGFSFAISSLTNTLTVFYFFCLNLVLLIEKKVIKILVIFSSFLFIYSFWLIRNYKVFNSFVYGSTNGGSTIYGLVSMPYDIHGDIEKQEKFRENDEVYIQAQKIDDEVQRDKFFLSNTKKKIILQPKEYIIKVIKNYLKFWKIYPHSIGRYGVSYKVIKIISISYYFPLLVFGFFGIILSKFWKDIKIFYVFLPLLVFPFFYALIWSQIRYRIPFEPYLIIFASYGMQQILFQKKLCKCQK